MKWYDPGWMKDYLQHNNFIKISVSTILIFIIVGTFCWSLFFGGVFLLIVYSVGGLYLSGYLFMGIVLLLGGDFP